MTPTQFIAQLNDLRRRRRRLLVFGGVLVFLIDLAIVLYVLRLYPLQAHSPGALVAHWAGFAACWPALVALYMALRKTSNRYAPVCRTCGAEATWKLRSQIVITGHCPACHAAFFTPLTGPRAGSLIPPGGMSGS
jgi:hypothetical protein